MMGFLKSSSLKPTARSMARLGERWTPWVTREERRGLGIVDPLFKADGRGLDVERDQGQGALEQVAGAAEGREARRRDAAFGQAGDEHAPALGEGGYGKGPLGQVQAEV